MTVNQHIREFRINKPSNELFRLNSQLYSIKLSPIILFKLYFILLKNKESIYQTPRKRVFPFKGIQEFPKDITPLFFQQNHTTNKK